MYEELIKKLRNDAKAFTGFVNEDLLKAADAIEDLEKCLAIALLEYQRANNKLLMTEEYTKQKNRWIPVTERLPEKDQTVLAYCAEDNFCYISRMHQSFEDYDVTHWIPLPQMQKARNHERIN